MKMTAKSEAEDDDSWIEAEIERELEKLTIDSFSSDDENSDKITDEVTPDKDSYLLRELYEVAMPSLDDYVLKVSRQMQNFEVELEECDRILHESEIVASRQSHVGDDLLESLAAEAGMDAQSLRQKVLLELQIQESAEDHEGRNLKDSETAWRLSSSDPSTMEAGTTNQKYFGDGSGRKYPVLPSLQSSAAATVEETPQSADVTECDSKTLEERFQFQLKEFERTQDLKEADRKRVEASLKRQENLLAEELTQNRHKRMIMIDQEANQLNGEKLKREEEFQRQKELLQKELEESLKESELHIEQLTKQVDLQREKLKRDLDEKQLQEEKQKAAAATKIQTTFRGFRIRKLYGSEVRDKIAKLRETKIQQRIMEMDEQRKEKARIKMEEERKAKEEEEERRRLREEETKRLEDEKRRKEEEILRKKEEKRLQKEEEKRAKEEAKKRKKEEERLRKEEEEKRGREEAQRRKEEEERKKREEEIERVRQEEEKSRRAEEERERKQKEEEEQQRKREEEILCPRENGEKLIGNESPYRHDTDRRESKELKTKSMHYDPEMQGSGDNSNMRISTDKGLTAPAMVVMASVDSNRISQESEVRSKVSPDHPDDQTGQRVTGEHLTILRTTDVRKSIGQSASVNNAKQPTGDLTKLSQSIDFNTQDLVKALEARKLLWMKENHSWSKSVSKQRSQKAMTSQNVPRVPPSAKNLPPLDEKFLLSSVAVRKLTEVTVIELCNLSACSLRTLSPCINLKVLVVNNCGVIATEGVELATNLQYVSLKNNKLEMMNFCGHRNLIYLDVSGNNLRSIHGLNGCQSLRHLDISHNRVTRIAGLESLEKLQVLLAAGNLLISTEGLAQVPCLQILDLSDNQLTNVESIESLGVLRVLDLGGNNFKTFPLLTNHAILNDLRLDHNSIVSLENLSRAWLPCLGYLKLGQNRLSSICDLRFCPMLQSIDVSANQIADVGRILSGLSSCQRLESLNVCGNALAEEKNYRNAIKKVVKTLQYLDGEQFTEDFNPNVKDDAWMLTCVSQVRDCRQLRENYVRSLENSQGKLSDINVHTEYFESCHQMAIEHRFFHEYGEKTPPQPPLAPKLLSRGEPSSGGTPTGMLLESAMQANDMKAKFELALSGAKPNSSEPSRTSSSGKEAQVTHLSTCAPERLVDGSDFGGISVARSSDGCPPCVEHRNVDKNPADSSAPRNARSVKAEEGVSKVPRDIFDSRNVDRTPKQSRANQTSRCDAISDKAAAKIQSLWRGYSLRRRLQQVQGWAYDDVTDDIMAVNLDDLMPKESWIEDNLKSLSPLSSHRYQSTFLPDGKFHANNNNNLHLADFLSKSRSFPREAWKSPNTSSALADILPLEYRQPFPPGKPPLPPPSRLSNLSDAHSTTAARSVIQEKVMEEWGFENPRSAELFLQRQKKMEQIARKKKFGELDPMRRLAAARRLEDITKSPPTIVATQKRERPRIEYFRGLREREMEREREIANERSQKANYTFEWIHTQVRHCDSAPGLKRGESESSLPLINQGFGNDRHTAMTASPSSMLDIHSLDGAGAPTGKQRRLSFNDDRLPLLTAADVTTKQTDDERISRRNPEVNRSIGWGGGKKRSAIRK